MASVFPTGNYDTAFLITTGVAGELLYSVPPAYLAVLITQIKAVSQSGGSSTIQAIAAVSGVDYDVTGVDSVTAGAALDVEFKPLVIKTGDQLKITSSGVFHVF